MHTKEIDFKRFITLRLFNIQLCSLLMTVKYLKSPHAIALSRCTQAEYTTLLIIATRAMFDYLRAGSKKYFKYLRVQFAAFL